VTYVPRHEGHITWDICPEAGHPQLHSEPPMSIGSDEFRNRLGYYLDLAAEGQELNITRWGKRFLRLTLWQPQLPEAQAA
jgi:hypothetical protein